VLWLAAGQKKGDLQIIQWKKSLCALQLFFQRDVVALKNHIVYNSQGE
jgi:hypothetical protein